MKVLREWFIDAPWGQIALISWGDAAGEPVLLVHGRQDSAATFIPLLEHLPNNYYYVGVDLPGHGKSDPFPMGVHLMRIHYMHPVEIVIKHLNWTQLVYLAHSMGSEIGQFYNAICPGRVKKFILLDPGPSYYPIFVDDFSKFYHAYYGTYYSNYEKFNSDEKVYSKRQALDAVMKARGLTEEQAQIILSRNMQCIGDDQYRLAWRKKLKFVAALKLPMEYYHWVISKNAPPTLVVASSEVDGDRIPLRDAGRKFITDFQNVLNNFVVETAEGGHDVHVTNPECVAKHVRAFLKKDFSRIESKI